MIVTERAPPVLRENTGTVFLVRIALRGVIQAVQTLQVVLVVEQELINQMQGKRAVYPAMELINIKIVQVKRVVKTVPMVKPQILAIQDVML